eukprot:1456781-Rhodomonas_salina.3
MKDTAFREVIHQAVAKKYSTVWGLVHQAPGEQGKDNMTTILGGVFGIWFSDKGRSRAEAANRMWLRVYYESSVAAWNAKGAPELRVRTPNAIQRTVDPDVSLMDALHVLWGTQARYDHLELGRWQCCGKSDCLADLVGSVSSRLDSDGASGARKPEPEAHVECSRA